MSWRARPFAVVLLLLAAPAAAAVHPLPDIDVDPTTGVVLSMATTFWEAPAGGYAPIQVTLRNEGTRPREYQLSFNATLGWQGARMESTFPVAAEPGATRRFDLLVPLGDDGDRGPRFTRLEVLVTGPGAPGGYVSLFQTHYSTMTSGGTVSPAVAMSETLAARHWDATKGYLEASDKTTLVGGRFDATQLPVDWRAYLGFSLVLLTAEEWDALAIDQRRGLEQWMAQGGHVARVGGETARSGYGLGTLETLPAGPAAEATTTALAARLRKEPTPTEEYAGWPPVQQLGAPPLPVTAVSLFMIAYAVVVGPLNLFLASRRPARNRALRVIWTIPVLSAIASVLLAATILINDGVGGDGYRFTLVAIEPERHEATVVQEQIERTGLLLTGSFATREPVALARLPVEEDRTYFSGRRGEQGERHDGWIRSRSLQAQLVRTARASRARLEKTVATDGGIEILSSLPDTLEHLYWRDDSGRVWHAAQVAPGRKVRLEPSAQKDFERWWKAQMFELGPRLRQAVNVPWGPEVAFGNATRSKAAIQTLESIRWQRQDALYVQPLR
jgi:hypothetical protein